MSLTPESEGFALHLNVSTCLAKDDNVDDDDDDKM